MANIDLDGARELIDKQQCARGHPKCEMVEVGHSSSRDNAYLTYQCPTCNRKLRYKVAKGGIENRHMQIRGDMDPE